MLWVASPRYPARTRKWGSSSYLAQRKLAARTAISRQTPFRLPPGHPARWIGLAGILALDRNDICQRSRALLRLSLPPGVQPLETIGNRNRNGDRNADSQHKHPNHRCRVHEPFHSVHLPGKCNDRRVTEKGCTTHTAVRLLVPIVSVAHTGWRIYGANDPFFSWGVG